MDLLDVLRETFDHATNVVAGVKARQLVAFLGRRP